MTIERTAVVAGVRAVVGQLAGGNRRRDWVP
jgi:hypothetical protein